MIADFPDVRQIAPGYCGPAALQAVCQWFDTGPESQEEYARILGTTAASGTPPTTLIVYAPQVGLRVQSFSNDYWLEQLIEHLELGHPVICPSQYYPEPAGQSGEGHYVVAWAVDGKTVTVQDPSRGRLVLSRQEWDERWHDRDATGLEYDHYGIACLGTVWEEE